MSDILGSVDSCVVTSFCDGFAGSFFTSMMGHYATKNCLEKTNLKNKNNGLSVVGDAMLGGTIVSTLSYIYSTIKGEKMNFLPNIIFWLTCIVFGATTHLIGEKLNDNTE